MIEGDFLMFLNEANGMDYLEKGLIDRNLDYYNLLTSPFYVWEFEDAMRAANILVKSVPSETPMDFGLGGFTRITINQIPNRQQISIDKFITVINNTNTLFDFLWRCYRCRCYIYYNRVSNGDIKLRFKFL